MSAREPSEIEQWAEAVAAEHLKPLGDRWLHTLGVVDLARELTPALSANEGGTLIAAAFVHDIGYAPRLAATGFHPLDGAEYIARAGFSRLAALVAHHGGARHEAQLRGLGALLARFAREDSRVAAALDFLDLSTGPRGERWPLSERLRDIVRRHRDDPAVVAALCATSSELKANFEAGQSLLRR